MNTVYANSLRTLFEQLFANRISESQTPGFTQIFPPWRLLDKWGCVRLDVGDETGLDSASQATKSCGTAIYMDRFFSGDRTYKVKTQIASLPNP